MSFILPKLKYKESELAPHLSANLIHYHYGTHTKKYYDTVNELTKGTMYEKFKTLEELITSGKLKRDTKLCNNVCQAWNHTFYWDSLHPPIEHNTPIDKISEQIDSTYGSFAKFKDEFAEVFNAGFGSTWTWLVMNNSKLKIVNTQNADNPLHEDNVTPLLCIDGWEHSWYLQYPADKVGYLKAMWNIIDWNAINDRYKE